MARPLRIEHPGGWYHITGRGNERRAIFRDARDRARFLELLAEMTQRFAVDIACFALLDNHYHLLLRLRDKQLSRALQWLNLNYTLWFNRRHGRSGHLFQGRFKSILFDPASGALELSRYVHLNPIRIASLGLGKERRAAAKAGSGPAPEASQVRARLARLRAYPWSSYRAYIGAARCPAWLDCAAILARNRGTLAQQREAYRSYTETGAREGVGTAGVWGELKEGCLLGSQRFLAQVRQRIAGGDKQKGATRLQRTALEWSDIIRVVEQLAGERWETLCTRHADTTRDLALYLGRRFGAFKLRELAAHAGLRRYGAVAMAIQRYARKAKQAPSESRRLTTALQMLNVKM